jgi:uncharacterized protein YndB with AHSA1/START domain
MTDAGDNPREAPSKEAIRVARTVIIRARRATVFRYFTDAARFAAWWGVGSRIDGRVGGEVHIRYPDGTTAGGQVLELVPDARVVLSYGYDGEGKPIPRGGSRVTITLADHPEGTRLDLVHEVHDAATAEEHLGGWRFQLSLFANVTAAEQHAALAPLCDRFLALWGEPDPERRARELGELCGDGVEFLDGYAALAGRNELLGHIAACRRFMPGVSLQRSGDVRHCQGTAVHDWTARAADGSARGQGTNVVTLAPDGRIARVVGIART